MPTLADVAKIAGVGVMSVSRVVNGTRKVSPQVERKVRAALDKIGYEPNEAARILKGTKASALGLIVPDIADPFFAACCSAVQEAAWESGYMTMLAASGHREDRERHEVELMLKRQIAGLLIAPIGSHNDHFLAAQRAGVPIVAIDRPLEHVESDSLTVDNRDASARATEHLIAHGHREILCVADDERVYTKLERVAGYAQAMRAAKLVQRTLLAGELAGSVAEQLDYALRSTTPPTAIFAASNIMGMEVLSYLQKKRIKIPQTMSLICFDDFSAATLVSPPVTVIQQPVAQLGQTAAHMLLDRLKGSDRPLKSLQLSTSLVIRKSCGC